MLANTPEPPYYAVIFTNALTDQTEGYEEMAEYMCTLALQQEGCLGFESARNAAGEGITVSYWKNQQAILQWKKHVEHLEAQEKGRSNWYKYYQTRICLVERDYSFTK